MCSGCCAIEDDLMTPHPADPDSSGSPTEPLPPFTSADNPTLPLPPFSASGSHRFPGPGNGSGARSESGTDSGSGAAGTAGTATRPNGFFTWLRSLGLVRGEDRWLGGVCSGIAARTGLDPVLVRGLFIVLGLFGGGLLLYGLAWALLPEPDGRIHTEEALRGSWTSGTTGALAACLLGAGSPSIFWAGDGLLGGFFWTLFWIVGLALAAYWFFTRSSRSQEKPRTSPSAARAYAGPAPDAPPPPPSTPSSSYRYAPGTPEFSGPRGAKAAKAARGRTRTSPAAAETAVVLGAVLLVIGTVLTLDYAGYVSIEHPAAVALAAAAAANGLGIVVLGALGRSSGVLGLTALAALAAAGVAGTNLGTYGTVVVADQADWTPTASQPATAGYTLAGVNGQLDLRYLSSETDFPVEVPVGLAASDLTILVPDNIPVVVSADLFAGSLMIDDGVSLTDSSGLWKSSDQRLNEPEGEALVLRIKGAASTVLVTVNESDLNQ